MQKSQIVRAKGIGTGKWESRIASHRIASYRRSSSHENGTAGTAHVVEFHSGFRRPLLGLEKDRLVFAAARTQFVRSRKRGVGANILSDAGSVTDLTVELVLVHTVGSGGFTDMAGAAGEHQLIGDAVFLGVEKVGALAAEAEVNLVGRLGVATSGRRGRTRRHCVGRVEIE